MAAIVIVINTDDAAFDDGPKAVAAMLIREVAAKLENNQDLPYRVLDPNGNTCGKVYSKSGK